MKHIDQISAKLNLIEKDLSMQPVSESCLAQTRDIMCSICDGDVGTQRRKGLCHYLCYKWYQTCESELFC